MAKITFDKDTIEGLEPPAGANRIDYAIDDVRGFAIQTTKAGSKRFMLVYVARESGRERRLVLGEYGRAPKLTVTAARRLAAEKRALVDLGRDPWLEAKQLRAQNEVHAARRSATLAALVAAYVEHLDASGKTSGPEIAGSFERNVAKPYPKIAKTPFDEITVEAVLPALRRLTRAGKWRAAEKLAIYLRSAYNAARAARIDAGGVAFDGFDVRANPLLELQVTRPDVGRDATPRDTLNEAELRAYWQAIAKIDSPHGAMMRLHLLTGAQRMEQLSRLTVEDFDREANIITLWDGKGRRKKPRRHDIPLIPDALEALDAMRGEDPQGPHLFTVSYGAVAAVPHTLAAAVRDVSRRLNSDNEVSVTITPGAIRRTVETRLAAAGVSMEIRAQLQSHGLGGIQARHYDRHDYHAEKLAALEVLRTLCDPKPDNVTPIRLRKAG